MVKIIFNNQNFKIKKYLLIKKILKLINDKKELYFNDIKISLETFENYLYLLQGKNEIKNNKELIENFRKIIEEKKNTINDLNFIIKEKEKEIKKLNKKVENFKNQINDKENCNCGIKGQIEIKKIKNAENGIIKYLRSISIEPIPSASSCRGNETPSKAIPNDYIPNNDYRYVSNEGANQWFQIQFNKKVKIDSYFMKHLEGHAPSNFVLEISDDMKNWLEVDRQNNINFVGKDFKKNLNQPCECFSARIRNIGKDSHNSDFLVIYYLEFFGHVYE